MIFTTGTFFFTVIRPLLGVSWWTPEPCRHGTARGGITTHFNKLRDNLFPWMVCDEASSCGW